ncbi:MAG TPA: MarR family winged helix-turn-helix transcriptional regulator [Mycobacteriales bacterium]|nr:MarR family winged helix-turn-helix transcriptional regulator [Mycobacteriales bacterium]
MSRRSVLLDLAVSNAFVSQLFDQELLRAGIQPAQVGILTLVREAEPVTPTHLEERSGVAGGTLRGHVRQLLRDGLVARRPNADDARSYFLVTTPQARTLLARARPVLRRVERMLDGALAGSLEDYRGALADLESAARALLERPVPGSAGTRTSGPW